MSNIKQIKFPDDYKEPSRLYIWWIETRLSDYYYDFTWKFIENPIFQIRRLYQWYQNVFKRDYDFDGCCLFAIIEYKLKRLEKVLSEGCGVQEPKDMKALKLAIKLAGRLKEDDYERRFIRIFQKKWKRITPGRTFLDEDVLPVPSDKQRACHDDWNRGYEGSEMRMQREERALYGILQKYLRVWWD